MGGFFHHDGPLVGLIAKVGDMILVNFLILVCSLPVVTLGAAFTAGSYAALRSIRGEGHVLRDFWRSFRENFVQATLIWLVMVAVLGVGTAAVWIWGRKIVALGVVLLAALILLALAGLWVFPVLARFSDTTGKILITGFVLCYRHLFRTLAMAAGWLIPAAVLILSLYALPGVILLGIGVPVFLCAGLANPVFAGLEQQIQSA